MVKESPDEKNLKSL